MPFRAHCVAEFLAHRFVPGGTNPSWITVQRWITRSQGELNSLRPFVRSGNNEAEALQGEDRFLLACYRLGYPKASAAEVIAFIHAHSSAPRIYSPSQITECEQDLGLSTKVGSTTAFQAFLPANLERRRHFWNSNFPLGVRDSFLDEFLDIDECGISIQVVNRSSGKAYLNIRVREEGPYERTQKWSLILAIRPDGGRWFRFSKDQGTTAVVFNDFLRHQILPTLDAPTTFLWDNLKSHHSPLVVNTVNTHGGGHRILARPNYRPQDGPIEYVNNQLITSLRIHCYDISTEDELVAIMPVLIANLSGFRETFEHCGY